MTIPYFSLLCLVNNSFFNKIYYF